MIPTRAQIKTRMQNILDDPAGSIYTEAVFAEAFSEAYDALFNALLNNQCPRITQIVTYTIPAGVTTVTPATMGIADFAGYMWLRERASASNNSFIEMISVDVLSQRSQQSRMVEFVFRGDAFYFIGATGAVDIQMEYESSGTAPTSDSALINIDGCLPFLSNYAAGVAGPRKGDDEIASRCMAMAVGPKYNLGTIGGELFRIIQPRVRQMQSTPIANRPYSARRRRRGSYLRATPFAGGGWSSGGGGTTINGGYYVVPVSNGIAPLDLSYGIVQEVTLTSSTSILTPANLVPGPFWIHLIQDNVGNWPVTFSGSYSGIDPTGFSGVSSGAGTLVILSLAVTDHFTIVYNGVNYGPA